MYFPVHHTKLLIPSAKVALLVVVGAFQSDKEKLKEYELKTS